jgi:hypothetical protein
VGDGYYKRKKNQFLVLAGNRFWLYILLCTWSTIVVVLCYFFWFWREIIFSVMYVLNVQYSCAVVSVSSVWRVLDHYHDRNKKKVLVVCLVGARLLLRPKKKSSSRLSGGLCCCVSFWFWWEIGFGCTYYYVLGVPYKCGVVLVFLVLVGNSIWCYVRT